MSTRILIVEDNQNNLYLMEYLLQHSGYTTLSALDGQQGLDAAQREQPDLILMDIQMPKMDGFELTRLLKENPATCEIPVVGVSSYATEGSRQTAQSVGMVAYIEKPIIPESFVSQVLPYLP